MNSILLQTKYRDYCKYLNLANEAIKNNDFGLPFELYPNEIHHPNPQDSWDNYENEKFNKNYDLNQIFWNNILRLAMRIKKLEKKRLMDPNYCNKSDSNIIKKYEYAYKYCNKYREVKILIDEFGK